MLKRNYIVGLISVIIGFIFASSLFGLLTTRAKSNEIVSLKQSIVVNKQEPAVNPAINIVKSELTKPTQPVSDNKDQPIIEIPAKKEIPVLTLGGIFSSQKGSLALINDRIVKEGDSILGVKVIRIYSNKVDMDADGEKVTLRIK